MLSEIGILSGQTDVGETLIVTILNNCAQLIKSSLSKDVKFPGPQSNANQRNAYTCITYINYHSLWVI